MATEAQFREALVLADVSQWTGKGPLVSLVLDVTSAVEWLERAVTFQRPTPAAPRPQILLTVLTYCYATGLLSSEEVEQASRRDLMVQYLCAGARPTAEQLRLFRRRHRPLIARCLGRVLFSAWQFRLWLGLTRDEGEKLPEWLGPDTWSEEEAATLFASAAEQRVDQAVLLDSTALDD